MAIIEKGYSPIIRLNCTFWSILVRDPKAELKTFSSSYLSWTAEEILYVLQDDVLHTMSMVASKERASCSQTIAARFNRDAETDAKWIRPLASQFGLFPYSDTVWTWIQGKSWSDFGENPTIPYWYASPGSHSVARQLSDNSSNSTES